eukprot:scaffold3682_cov30-Tisochrysis_lutea.AAC.1
MPVAVLSVSGMGVVRPFHSRKGATNTNVAVRGRVLLCRNAERGERSRLGARARDASGCNCKTAEERHLPFHQLSPAVRPLAVAIDGPVSNAARPPLAFRLL